MYQIHVTFPQTSKNTGNAPKFSPNFNDSIVIHYDDNIKLEPPNAAT